MDDEYIIVYTRRIRHYRTGRFIYPKKGKVFRLKIKRKK